MGWAIRAFQPVEAEGMFGRERGILSLEIERYATEVACLPPAWYYHDGIGVKITLSSNLAFTFRNLNSTDQCGGIW
jgi:hypothetical protein